MSLSTTGWLHSVPISLDNTNVDSNQNNFIAFLSDNMANYPARKIHTGIGQARFDGRDVRFTTDAAGVTEIPVDIIQWHNTLGSGQATSTSANKLVDSGAAFSSSIRVGDRVDNFTDDTFAHVTSVDSDTELTLDSDIFTTGEEYNISRVRIKTNVPTLSSGSSTTIYMWWGNSKVSFPDVTDTYGRNNVYTGNDAYGSWGLNEGQGQNTIDRSGNGYTGNIEGGTTVAPGKLVQSQNFDGSGDRFDIQGSDTPEFEGEGTSPPSAFSGSAWFYWDGGNDGSVKAFLSKRATSSPNEGWELQLDANEKVTIHVDGGTNDAYVESATTVLANTWYFGWFITDGSGDPTNFKIGINGADDSNFRGSVVTGNITNGNRIGIASRKGSAGAVEFSGRIEDCNFYRGEKSVDWFKAQYHNQNDVATFASCGTVVNNVVFPQDWNPARKIKVVTGDLSGVIASDVNSLPTEMGENSIASAPDFFSVIQDGGGAIRITSDENGNNILAIDVDVADVSSEKFSIWVLDAIKASGGNEVFIWYDCNKTVYQPAHESPAGKYTTWASIQTVGEWHLSEIGNGTADEYKDSSGTGNHGVGSSAPTRVDGNMAYAQQGNDLDQQINIGDQSFPTGSVACTMWGSANFPGDGSEQTIWGYGTDTDGQRRVLQQRSQGTGIHFSGHFWGTPDLPSGWKTITARVPAGATMTTDVEVFIDGVQITPQTLSGSPQTLNTVKNVSRILRGTNGAFGDTPVDDCGICLTELSDDQIALQAFNMLNTDPIYKSVISKNKNFTANYNKKYLGGYLL